MTGACPSSLDEVQDRAIGRAIRERSSGRPSALIDAPTGTGKAQPLDAKVLTPRGWTTMGQVRVGDMVVEGLGLPVRVSGVYPQGVLPIFKVTFSDGSSTECCGEHLWYVRDRRAQVNGSREQWFVHPTDHLRANLLHSDGRDRWAIPMVEPICFGARDLPVDPYLLGLLLGDGSFRSSGIGFSNPEAELQAAVGMSISREDRMVETKDGIDFWIRGGQLRAEIERLGLLGLKSTEKFIPQPYLFSHLDDRMALLQGLLDTDGYTDGYNVEYSTSSPRLAEDFRDLVESLGGRLTVSSRIPAYVYKGERREGKRSYRILVSLPGQVDPFRLERKKSVYIPRTKYPPRRSIAAIDPAGFKECRCIAVDDDTHLYVTDRFIVTHNTRVASLFMDRLVRSEGARFLFLAHRKELVRQTEAHLGMLGIPCAVEMADRRAPRPGESLWDVPVVIGSKDTLQKARLLQWPRDSFTDIIIDESHLSLAKSFGNITDHFACRFLLGLSATPFRMDGRSLFPEPFATRIRAYDPGPRESSLAVAVRMGHLCPLEAITCDLGIDLRGISSRKQAHGRDFAPGELEARIAAKVGVIANAVRQEIDAIGSRRALLFAPDVPSTVALATALRQVGIPAAAVHGHTKAYPMPDGLRDHRLAQLAEGDIRVLCNCEILTCGYNLPAIDAIVMARPTQSIPLFFQMIGRGTRNAPGKDRCCIIGFRWESDDDDAIVSTVDLFLAEEADIKARRLARKLARGPKQLADPELVARRAAEIAGREEERARREAERKLRIAARKKDIRYRRRVFDPLNVGAVFGVRSCTDPGPGDVIPATPQQVAALKHYGMEDCTGLSASQAQQLVESFLDRDFLGLASPRAVRFLVEKGRLSPEFVRGLTQPEAASHIRRIIGGFQSSRPARAV